MIGTRKQFTLRALGVVAIALLAGCGSGQTDTGSLGMVRQLAAPALAKVGLGAKPAAPAAAPNPEAMASRALAANPNPLILVGIESLGGMQVMALNGSNGDMRTYMTPSMQAIVTRRGLVTGTKGFGHDLSSADLNGVAPLILGRRAGEGTRTMRYIMGDAVERPVTVTCKVTPGPRQSVPFAGRTWAGTTVAESCHGSGVKFVNSYLVGDNGTALISQQWVGPRMGSVTIQTIRD
ncbi:YjbF family lipoprotein [Paracoccus sp. p4-l81]|uniref:YjbF family lipoprotein n=1 Tax=Paracoccus sp. p4-l81 TaxID=3342806 RepID=UPI0035BB5AF8